KRKQTDLLEEEQACTGSYSIFDLSLSPSVFNSRSNEEKPAYGSLASRTVEVCWARNASSEPLIFESFNASSAAANKAALIAPALPMAKVATGTPPGICTIESRESIPFKLWDSTGTPRTGRAVNDAVMP